MPDLVRAVVGDIEKNVGRAFAEAKGLEVLDEPTTRPDGSLRPTTRVGGRRVKPKTTVEAEAKKKPAAKTEKADASKVDSD